MKKNIFGICFIILAIVSFQTQDVQAQFKVTRTFKVGGTGGWDYIAVNHALNRIYVSHDTVVNILDQTTGEKAGVISGTTGIHGIAFVDNLGKGYTSNGRINNVTVFDLKTNKILKQVGVGKNPDAIIYDDFSKKIITCNGRGSDATILDPVTDAVVATIPLGGKPETPVSNGAGKVYINIEDKSEIAEIDMKSFKVEKRWKLGKGEEPSGLAIDRKNKRLFAGCSNKLMVVLNAETGKVVAELPIGNGSDGIAIDTGSGNIYSSNGEGTLSVIHMINADKYEVMPAVPTKKGARTLTVDEANHKIYLPAAEYGKAPEATKETPRPRPSIVPDSFQVLEVGN